MDLALFDFDGTITDRETMPDFMRWAVRPRRLALGRVLLFPLVIGYKAKLVPGSFIRAAICFFGFAGIPVNEVEAHGRRFAQEHLPATLRKNAMARIGWHKARGDTVVVVSGGLDIYLRHWCHEHGVELLCSSLQQRSGTFTGRYHGRQCVREHKARLVRERFSLQAFGRVFAYGDTPEDRELLALAHQAYYRWQRSGRGNRVDLRRRTTLCSRAAVDFLTFVGRRRPTERERYAHMVLRALAITEWLIGVALLLLAGVLGANTYFCFFNKGACGMVEPLVAVVAMAIGCSVLAASFLHHKRKVLAGLLAYLPVAAIVLVLAGQALQWW